MARPACSARSLPCAAGSSRRAASAVSLSSGWRSWRGRGTKEGKRRTFGVGSLADASSVDLRASCSCLNRACSIATSAIRLQYSTKKHVGPLQNSRSLLSQAPTDHPQRTESTFRGDRSPFKQISSSFAGVRRVCSTLYFSDVILSEAPLNASFRCLGRWRRRSFCAMAVSTWSWIVRRTARAPTSSILVFFARASTAGLA